MKPAAQLRDAFQLLRSIRPHKALNYFLLQWSSMLSLLLKTPVLLGMPAYIHIEPTNRCNLSCPECPTGAGLLTRPQGVMRFENFSNILASLAPKAFYLNLYFQGEPLLHATLPAMIHHAREKGLYVVTSTNAQHLDPVIAKSLVESGLNRIIISFDGPDATTYETYRKGGSWDKVQQAVRNLREAKTSLRSTTPLIVLQCLLFHSNEYSQGAVRLLAKELGADSLEFKTLQLLDITRPSDLLPHQQKLSRYRPSDQGAYQLRKLRHTACSHLFNSCIITWDGKVVPCCYDKNADHSYGTLDMQPFREVWPGAKRRSFITEVLQRRQHLGMCNNCRE
jgi:radical SAM protein with 4Fe4S-binding SPASM domain